MTEAAASDCDDAALASLLEVIFKRFHYDFRRYCAASVRRRLGLAMRALDCANVDELQARIAADPLAFPALLRFLTVQVSDLFRDPSYYRVFRNQIVPILRTYPSLKIWIAGCSAGEELYSFAILLRETGLLDKTILYATDISTEALKAAEAGIFPLDRLRAFTANHQASGAPGSLSDFYTAKYGSAVFDRTLRKHVVFADHSLATDSVFAEVQVVSCRNVLIYFERPLQDRTIGVLHDSLCVRGFLGLGSKERLRFTSHAHAFDTYSEEDRWYRRRESIRRE